MTKPKVLCVCTMGLNRSKWVANYLKTKGYKTRYGGVGPLKWDDGSDNPINQDDVDWAEVILTAREKHKPLLEKKFGARNKKIIVLEVSDTPANVGEEHANYRNLSQAEFNKVWTYPKLKEAIDKHLPLKIVKNPLLSINKKQPFFINVLVVTIEK